MRSTTSVMSFGARMRLTTFDLSLRKVCPEGREGSRQCRIAVGGPERDEIASLATRDAAQLDRRSGRRRDSFGLGERRANLVGRDRLVIGGQHEPRRGAS